MPIAVLHQRQRRGKRARASSSQDTEATRPPGLERVRGFALTNSLQVSVRCTQDTVNSPRDRIADTAVAPAGGGAAWAARDRSDPRKWGWCRKIRRDSSPAHRDRSVVFEPTKRCVQVIPHAAGTSRAVQTLNTEGRPKAPHPPSLERAFRDPGTGGEFAIGDGLVHGENRAR